MHHLRLIFLAFYKSLVERHQQFINGESWTSIVKEVLIITPMRPKAKEVNPVQMSKQVNHPSGWSPVTIALAYRTFAHVFRSTFQKLSRTRTTTVRTTTVMTPTARSLRTRSIPTKQRMRAASVASHAFIAGTLNTLKSL
jgi:hypothetical protein